MKTSVLGVMASAAMLASTLCLTSGLTASGRDPVSPKAQILSIEGLDNLKSSTNAETKTKRERPKMEIAFCIDTTGSMSGEIDMVKKKVKELVAKLSSGSPAPIVQVGLVAYRDRGDEYVTKVFPFTDNIDAFVKDVSGLVAAGGGDGPESVNAGLHDAVNKLSWSTDKKTSKLLFLIGDAGPHEDYAGDYKWSDEAKKAITRGIQINAIGCEGLQSYPAAQGVDVFKKIATLSDGKFEMLAYHQEIVDATGRRSSIITSGGKSYMISDARKADWKAGASELKSKGLAREMTAADMAIAPASPMSMAAPSGMAFSKAALRRTAQGAGEAEAVAGFPAANREENNLDEIMVNAAKKKAEKDLDIKYGR